MSEISSDYGTKLKELWDKLAHLRLYVPYFGDNEDVDDTVKRIFDKKKKHVPTWLNDALIFTPIITSYEDVFRSKYDRIKETQNQILDALIDRDDRNNKIEDLESSQETVYSLKREIKALEQEKREIEKNIVAFEPQKNKVLQKTTEIDDEYTTLAVIYRKFREEFESVKQTFLVAETTHDEYSKENQVLQEQFHKTTADLQTYRKTLDEMGRFAKRIEEHKVSLLKRHESLNLIIAQLEQTKIDNAKTISKLEDNYADHQQLISSYLILEDKIKKQEHTQETVLSKMITAVELCEDASSDAQKMKMTKDMYQEELHRINEVILSTEKKFDNAVSEQEEQMKSQFESALNTINIRIKQIEGENSQLEHDKEGIMKQVNSANQENSILKATKSDNGFSNFVETISSLKAEIEATFTRKEQTANSIEHTKQSIENCKDKELQVRQDSKVEQTALLQRRQQVEMELEMQKAVLKEIMEKNSQVLTDNLRIKNEINQMNRINENSIQDEIKVKESSITELKVQLDEVLKSNERAINEIQQAILGIRQNGEKWKMKADTINNDADDQHNQLESQLETLQDNIQDLNEQVRIKRQDNTAASIIGDQLTAEISNLRQMLDEYDKKNKRRAGEIGQTLGMIQEVSDYTKYINMIDTLDSQIRQKKREIKSISKSASKVLDEISGI